MENKNINPRNIAKAVFEDISKIRNKSPLIHNITNFVVMESSANALLALGASPIMAHAEEELSDIVNIASSLVINIGTLDNDWVDSMHKAMWFAGERKIPIILDPVGVGATKFRTDTAIKLMQKVSPTVIRGNGSEIFSLIKDGGSTKGVDSTIDSKNSIDSASTLVEKYKCIVAISGATDVCLSNNKKVLVKNGSSLMTKVTGMGCASSAIIGAFCAVNSDPFEAALHSMITVGISGQIASAKANGPGTFLPIFYDTLYNLDEKTLLEKIDIA